MLFQLVAVNFSDGAVMSTSSMTSGPHRVVSWKRFSNDEMVEEALKKGLKVLAVEVYDNCIQKLMPRLQKCLDVDGDYVEK